ncbi:hypothetical protein BJ166DRAFT_104921 [Pestalotiopsis sp. NC0098]|nr:hypothetical protein BJ166DRAFT_104921 [Pestalotiopsis sp. NC0098]
MVARTPPMASLKKGLKNSILPQIHQPLPLNKRESQQLLNSITSSFRKNLDKEHPWQSQDSAEKAMSAALVKSRPSSETAQKHRPTDRHLDSILSNPLFAQRSAATTATTTALQQHHDIFDSASSKGMMTVRRAAGYLASIHRELQVPTLDAPSAVAASGAGLRVVQWLRSSGAENSLEFLSDQMLMPLLVRFMFVEGLEEVAWTWLSRLGAQLHTLPKDGQTQQSLVCLLQVIRLAQAYKDHALASSKASLDASYSTFLRANQTLPAQDPAALKGLQRYWHSLSWSSTVHASHYQTPSAPLFDMFTDIGRPWKKPMDIAHLELHHPTNPDHSSAVTYLHDGHVVRSAEKLKTSAKYVERMVSLGTDTVDRLQVVGDEREASWVSEFMARTFFAWNLRPEGK